MKPSLPTLLGTVLLGLVLPAVALRSVAGKRPEVAVRSRPLHVHAGKLSQRAPIGQTFRCRWDGLRRIDVRAVAPRKLDAGPVTLTVRLDAPDGEVVRTAAARPKDASGQWLELEFEPIADSAGRDVTFTLTPESPATEHPLRPWMRPRGQLGVARPWGGETTSGASAELSFVSELPDLSAIAVAMESVAPDATLVLEVFEGDDAEPARRVERSGLDLTAGYALFSFDPLADSYARSHHVVLHVPATAAARTQDGELSARVYHGAHVALDELRGMTRAGVPYEDRDLVFRAWTSPSLGDVVGRLHERIGGRWIVALLLWNACVALVLELVLGRR